MSFSTRRNGGDSGFTLIEVLVAIAILALIASFLAAAFVSTFRIVDQVYADGNRDQVARVALQVMADEIGLARAEGDYPLIGKSGRIGGRPADLLAFVSITRDASLGFGLASPLSRVAYLREGDRLVRFSTRNLYGSTSDSILREELATGVHGFEVRYFNAETRQWAEDWQARRDEALPQAVLVELTLEGQDGAPLRTFIQWINIQARTL